MAAGSGKICWLGYEGFSFRTSYFAEEQVSFHYAFEKQMFTSIWMRERCLKESQLLSLPEIGHLC